MNTNVVIRVIQPKACDNVKALHYGVCSYFITHCWIMITQQNLVGLIVPIMLSFSESFGAACDDDLRQIQHDIAGMRDVIANLHARAAELHGQEMKVRRIAAYYSCEAYFDYRQNQDGYYASASYDGDDDDEGGGGAGGGGEDEIDTGTPGDDELATDQPMIARTVDLAIDRSITVQAAAIARSKSLAKRKRNLPDVLTSADERYNSYNGTIMSGYCHKRSQNAAGGVQFRLLTALGLALTLTVIG